MEIKQLRLYLQRLGDRTTVASPVINRWLKLTDVKLIMQTENIDSDFYRSFSIIEATLASHFDFAAISATAIKSTAVLAKPPILDRFTTAFDTVYTTLLQVAALQTTKDTSFDMWELTTRIVLKMAPEKKLKYWQNEGMNQIMIAALRGFFTEKMKSDARNEIEILCLMRPSILRELFGVESKVKDMECIAYLIEDCFELPAVYTVHEYQEILNEFKTRNLDDNQVLTLLKEEVMEVLDLDPNMTQDEIPKVLVTLAQKIQNNKNMFYKRGERKVEDSKSVIHAIVTRLKPFATKYNTADKLKDKFKSDWRKTILPRLLAYLSTRTEISDKQKQVLSDLFGHIQNVFKTNPNPNPNSDPDATTNETENVAPTTHESTENPASSASTDE